MAELRPVVCDLYSDPQTLVVFHNTSDYFAFDTTTKVYFSFPRDLTKSLFYLQPFLIETYLAERNQ